MKTGAIIVACVVGAAVLSGNALAATFTVTKLDDTNDGVCDADCSLREAVRAANVTPGPDSIVLAAGAYQLSIAGRFEDAAARGDLDVSGDLAVSGAGRDDTVIYGIVDRVFDVLPGAALTLADLGLASGNPSDLFSGIPFDLDSESGGALKNRGTLTLTDVDVSFSFASGRAGAGSSTRARRRSPASRSRATSPAPAPSSATPTTRAAASTTREPSPSPT